MHLSNVWNFNIFLLLISSANPTCFFCFDPRFRVAKHCWKIWPTSAPTVLDVAVHCNCNQWNYSCTEETYGCAQCTAMERGPTAFDPAQWTAADSLLTVAHWTSLQQLHDWHTLHVGFLFVQVQVQAQVQIQKTQQDNLMTALQLHNCFTMLCYHRRWSSSQAGQGYPSNPIQHLGLIVPNCSEPFNIDPTRPDQTRPVQIIPCGHL